MKLTTKKAQELYDKASPLAYHNVFSFREETFHKNRQRIAHIVADEVISEITRLDQKFKYNLPGTIQFWEEVKTEIDNIQLTIKK